MRFSFQIQRITRQKM